MGKLTARQVLSFWDLDNIGKFTLSDNALKYCCRAKYYPNIDGSLRLASIQTFNIPMFRPAGWENRKKKNKCSISFGDDEVVNSPVDNSADRERATRRAKKNAFDIIMCNHDLDLFATFTYSPERVGDKADYDECYEYLRGWLSNRVQRNGLKYVCVPERTKIGDIHFHAIMNSTALKLAPAVSPKTGRLLTKKGKTLFNVSDWKRGFSSAEKITAQGADDEARVKVSKYIFKYMGKQSCQKIGGRYVLIGGDIVKPVYAYGDAPSEFLNGQKPTFQPNPCVIGDVVYTELGFI